MIFTSVSDKLKEARKKAGAGKAVEEKPATETKEECPFCHRMYKDVERHEKTCKDNPAVKEKAETSGKVQADDDSPAFKTIIERVERIVSDNQKVFDDRIAMVGSVSRQVEAIDSEQKMMKEAIEKRRSSSASVIYTRLIEFCKGNQGNPKFKAIVDNCTDARRHWRAIVIDVIDALVAMGVI